MLPKKFRLTPIEFHRQPTKSHTKKCFFGFIAVKPSNNNFPRFSVIVPFSLDKRSSYRHRTKRIIIEAIRKFLPTFKKNKDVMIKTSNILKKKDRLLVEKEIGRVFKEIGLFSS